MSEKLVIKNIGLLLSGDLARPILDADTIVAVDGRIAEVGKAKQVDASGAAKTVDAKGTTVAPGLIDSPSSSRTTWRISSRRSSIPSPNSMAAPSPWAGMGVSTTARPA